MDNVLVNGLVAVAENFRNLLVNVTGRFGDVLGGLETASQNSTRECPIVCVRGLGLQVLRESVWVCHS